MRLRVLTYNIHKGIGGVDRRYVPQRIFRVFEQVAPDVALLQEVDEGTRRTRADRQVDLIGDAVGLPHRAWFPNVRVRGGGAYGNAVLSRFPLTSVENIDLTIGRRKRRSALHARVQVPPDEASPEGLAQSVHVVSLHLGLWEGERRRQLARLFAGDPLQRLDEQTPVIVGGDFNDVFGSLAVRHLTPAGFDGHGRMNTFPAFAPVRALDAIYVRGDVRLLNVEPARSTTARNASDHLPLVADAFLERGAAGS